MAEVGPGHPDHHVPEGAEPVLAPLLRHEVTGAAVLDQAVELDEHRCAVHDEVGAP
jgi:hypothetical protein